MTGASLLAGRSLGEQVTHSGEVASGSVSSAPRQLAFPHSLLLRNNHNQQRTRPAGCKSRTPATAWVAASWAAEPGLPGKAGHITCKAQCERKRPRLRKAENTFPLTFEVPFFPYQGVFNWPFELTSLGKGLQAFAGPQPPVGPCRPHRPHAQARDPRCSGAGTGCWEPPAGCRAPSPVCGVHARCPTAQDKRKTFHLRPGMVIAGPQSLHGCGDTKLALLPLWEQGREEQSDMGLTAW